MLDSVALGVVIGLVFIYLLYSLLATVLSEMIATLLGLRARNLRAAISRMLAGEQPSGFAARLLNSIRIAGSPENESTRIFYSNPGIKLLGSNGLFPHPSFIRPESFSGAIVGELSGDKPQSPDQIRKVLHSGSTGGLLGAGPGKYVLGLWIEAGEDISRFKVLLEEWFNRTMEQASEWYKRKIQLVLVVLGFGIAWFLGADTFVIVNKLSVDHAAREQLVALAEARASARPLNTDTTFQEIRRKLDDDIRSAGSLLGLGGWLPRKVEVTTEQATGKKIYSPAIDPECLTFTDAKVSSGTLTFTFGERIAYLFRLTWYHFFGFLTTAVAISLGAPFWFDLLNKIIRFRTSFKQK